MKNHLGAGPRAKEFQSQHSFNGHDEKEPMKIGPTKIYKAYSSRQHFRSEDPQIFCGGGTYLRIDPSYLRIEISHGFFGRAGAEKRTAKEGLPKMQARLGSDFPHWTLENHWKMVV